MFYSFYNFLNERNLPSNLNGILIGLFSASGLVIRPIISPKLNSDNAILALAISFLLTALSLLLYNYVNSLIPMVLLRILHGAAVVTSISACIAILMLFMPPEKSGQGFGIIGVMTLAPYAIVPLIVENFFGSTPLGNIYAYTAFVMLPPVIMLFPLASKLKKLARNTVTTKKLPPGAILQNISEGKISLLLIANGLIFIVFAVIFFFLKTFCAQSGIGEPSIFFSISTCVIVVTRVFFGPLFDKYNKATLIQCSLFIFSIAVLLLGAMTNLTIFYIAAIIYGAGFGAASPLMNGLMFNLSKPEFRGLNTNLMLQMCDIGFFIGPALGAFALSTNLTQQQILSACAGIIVCAILLIFTIQQSRE